MMPRMLDYVGKSIRLSWEEGKIASNKRFSIFLISCIILTISQSGWISWLTAFTNHYKLGISFKQNILEVESRCSDASEFAWQLYILPTKYFLLFHNLSKHIKLHLPNLSKLLLRSHYLGQSHQNWIYTNLWEECIMVCYLNPALGDTHATWWYNDGTDTQEACSTDYNRFMWACMEFCGLSAINLNDWDW